MSLSTGEAASLLRAADVVLSEEDAAELYRRTEGWPVGLYLAALYLREAARWRARRPRSAVMTDSSVSTWSQVLARISSSQRAFLTRTAVLERMSAAVRAVLDQPGSGAILAELARSNLLLVPLDRRGQWQRYHHLFRTCCWRSWNGWNPA
jgi:LuxR family maltose regulon positive regulatory protein